MYKGRIASTTVTANTNIPFANVWNTNANTAYDSTNDAIGLLTAGYYDVMVNLVVTGSAGANISAQLYVNDVAVPESIATVDITANTGIETLTVFDTIRVVHTPIPEFADVSVRLSGNATISSGVITIEKRK